VISCLVGGCYFLGEYDLWKKVSLHKVASSYQSRNSQFVTANASAKLNWTVATNLKSDSRPHL